MTIWPLSSEKTVDKVQAILDGLNGDEMERLLEMLKKNNPD